MQRKQKARTEDGHNNETTLKGDAKILYEAYLEFSKAGMTADKNANLSKIDDVLKDASIQLTKDGGAVITDSDGKSTKIFCR